MQSVAWASMLVKFSRTDTFAVAVEKTFNGKHGCNLCDLVQKGRKTEQKQAAQAAALKIDFFLVQSSRFVTSAMAFEPIPFAPELWSFLPASPPSPPPKAA